MLIEQKFKLGDEGRMYLKTTQGPFKKNTLKELKPVKVNSTQKTKDDNTLNKVFLNTTSFSMQLTMKRS